MEYRPTYVFKDLLYPSPFTHKTDSDMKFISIDSNYYNNTRFLHGVNKNGYLLLM